MPQFSAASRANLAECHPELQRLFEEVVRWYDCTVTDGARTLAEQERNVARGLSKTLDSKHLRQADGTAHAADVVPYPPPNWNAVERGLQALRHVDPRFDLPRCYYFAGFVAGVAAVLGVPLRQGCDWNGDQQFADSTFIDLPHNELKG